MPNKSMAHDEHAVLFAKLDKTIAGGKVVLARLGMDQRPLQNVFGSDRIELSAHDFNAARIVFEEVPSVQCGADLEVLVEDFF